MTASDGEVAPTIRDVARAANVSVSTVSRAFSLPDLLREETRDHVLTVADGLGYRPNRAARGLITGKTYNVGVVVPDLGNPFFPGVLKGAQVRAREADYAVFLADAEENPRLEAELVRAMAKQVDGVMICSSRLADGQLQQLRTLTTLVLLNRRVHGISAVLLDAAGGMRQAVDHLAALGHRRIAYLAGPVTSWSNRERRRGLRLAARAHGLEAIELGPFAPHFQAGEHAADLALAAEVSAIVAYNDLIALGVVSRLTARGVDIPHAISVVGFDDIPMAGMATPRLTTVSLPTELAGRMGVELLLERLARPASAEAHEESLPAQLVVRASTAPPGGARSDRSTIHRPLTEATVEG